MEYKKFTARKDDEGRRLDKIVRIFLPGISLAQVYKYIRKGLIRVNDKRAKNDSRISEGDEIQIAAFIFNNGSGLESKDEKNKADFQDDWEPDIVFQNQHILVINKPYDISVHGSKNSLEKKILGWYEKNIHKTSLSFRPGPLHRLDRKTTGLLCFSLSLEGARWFSKNIQEHVIQKKYQALLEGHVLKACWNDKIKKNQEDEVFHRVKASLSEDNSDGDSALTFVTPLAYGRYKYKDFEKEVTLCELDIKTGRTHQIRAQSALHSHPLLGDTAYGGEKIKSEMDFYLQAVSLSFPKDNPLALPSEIKIRLNDSFIKILKSCSIFEGLGL